VRIIAFETIQQCWKT